MVELNSRAYEQIYNNEKRIIGKSYETKPVLEAKNTGAMFVETDTGKIFDWVVDKWIEGK